MAWDSSRPVPWRRLAREWAIYVIIMGVVFAVFFRSSSMVGVFAGLLVSGPLYLAIGAVMAKFGYQRKSLRQARAGAVEARAAKQAGDRAHDTAPRPKPAPTKRTGAGPTRPGGSRRR